MAQQNHDNRNRPADDHQAVDSEHYNSYLTGYENIIGAGGEDTAGTLQIAKDASSELMSILRSEGALTPSAFSGLDVALSQAGGPWETTRITQNTIYGAPEVINASLNQPDKFETLSELLLEAGYEGELSDQDMALILEELKKVDPNVIDGKADTVKLVEEIKRMQLEATVRAINVHDALESITDYDSRAAAINEMYKQLNGQSPALARMTELTLQKLFAKDLERVNENRESVTYSVREYVEQKLNNEALYDRGFFKELFSSGTLSEEDVKLEAKLAAELFDGLTPERQRQMAEAVAANLNEIKPGNGTLHNVVEYLAGGTAGAIGGILKGNVMSGLLTGVSTAGLSNDFMHRMNTEDIRALERNLLGLTKEQIDDLEKLVGEQDIKDRSVEAFHAENLEDTLGKGGLKTLPKEHTALTTDEEVDARAKAIIEALSREGVQTDLSTVENVTERAAQDNEALKKAQELLIVLSAADKEKVMSRIEEQLKTEPKPIYKQDDQGEVILDSDGNPVVEKTIYVVPEGSPANYEALVNSRFEESHDVGTYVIASTTSAVNPELLAQELLTRAKAEKGFYKLPEGELPTEIYQDSQDRLTRMFKEKLSLLTREEAKAVIEAYDALMKRQINLGEGIINGVDAKNNARLVRLYEHGTPNIFDQLDAETIYSRDMYELMVMTNSSTHALPDDPQAREELRKKIEALPNPTEDLKRVFVDQMEDPKTLMDTVRGKSDDELRIYKAMLYKQFGDEGIHVLEQTLSTAEQEQFHASSDLGLNAWDRTAELHALIENSQGLSTEDQTEKIRKLLEAAYTTNTEGKKRSLEEQQRAADLIREVYQEEHGSELTDFLKQHAPEILYFPEAAKVQLGLSGSHGAKGDMVQELALSTPEKLKAIEASFHHYFPE